jgi:hypothetical protein
MSHFLVASQAVSGSLLRHSGKFPSLLKENLSDMFHPDNIKNK